ncbi:MAG: isocitrate lyase/phosphoenolpyruvate mutase family protein [Burkholderiales bacterium]
MNPRKALRQQLAKPGYVIVPGARDTLTEVTQRLARTVKAVEIPVIADLDAGYGNALNVIRAVREYERTGVAAFHLEDQVSPEKCGHAEGKQSVGTAEMVGKIKAAVGTRRDPDMMVKPALANVFEGGKTPPLPAKDLESMGFRIGISPSQAHRAAIAAAKKVLAVLRRDGDTAAIERELATFTDREEAVNAHH